MALVLGLRMSQAIGLADGSAHEFNSSSPSLVISDLNILITDYLKLVTPLGIWPKWQIIHFPRSFQESKHSWLSLTTKFSCCCS